MSCWMSASATTTSPTRTSAPRPPATPVKMICWQAISVSNTVVVVAAATLPMRESTATMSRPCRWPTQKVRPARWTGSASGMASSRDWSSSGRAAITPMRPGVDNMES